MLAWPQSHKRHCVPAGTLLPWAALFHLMFSVWAFSWARYPHPSTSPLATSIFGDYVRRVGKMATCLQPKEYKGFTLTPEFNILHAIRQTGLCIPISCSTCALSHVHPIMCIQSCAFSHVHSVMCIQSCAFSLVLQVSAVVVSELPIKYTCAVQVHVDRQNMQPRTIHVWAGESMTRKAPMQRYWHLHNT